MSLISFSRDKFIPSDEVSLNVRGNYLSVTRGYQVFTFFKTTNNGIPQQKTHVKTEKDSVGISTYIGINTFSQTENTKQYNMGTSMDMHRGNTYSQTHTIKHIEFSVNTNSSNGQF